MSSVRARLRSPLAAGLLAGVLVSFAVVALRSMGGLERLELAAHDWYISVLPGPSIPDSRIVLIAITERDIRNQGGRYPLPDAMLAQALEKLAQYRPRAIGLDIYRDFEVPPGREALDAVLNSHPHIIGVMKFGEGESDGVPPPPVLEGTDRVGFNDILVDPDGVVRRGLLYLGDEDPPFHSLALRLALLYLKAQGIMPPLDSEYLRLGPTTVRPFEANDGGYVRADARGYQFLLDFKGSRWSFPSYTLTNLLSDAIDPGAIKDKIVLIGYGAKAESVKDLFTTPYSRGLAIPGIELHAHVVSQLLRFGLRESAPVATVSEWQEWLWILLWSAMGGAMGLRVRSPWRFSLLATFDLLILAVIAYLVFWGGWWIPVVPPAMTWVAAAGVVTAYMSNQEKRQRALLMQLFSKYTSPEVAEAIWQQRDQLLDGGRIRPQTLTATVLISDLQGSTAMSEKMDPQALMDWLNSYMETMGQLVLAHKGAIDDYRGDGFKADFGVPFPRTTEAEVSRDAVHAVNCALAMERGLQRLNRRWQAQGLPTARARIGIHTGPVVAGSLGAAQRLQYTTVGDTANIAARLESFEKDLDAPDSLDSPCRILIGEATLWYLGDRFTTQKIGEVRLRGKDEKITIYRVLGRADENPGGIGQEGGV